MEGSKGGREHLGEAALMFYAQQTDAGGRQTNINCNCKWREMSEWLSE